MAEQPVHLVELAETIGPREAFTEAEERAADYVRGVLTARGLDVETQEFEAARSISAAFAVYAVVGILAAVGSRWLPWWLMALVALVAAYFAKREMDTRSGLSSFLPKGTSRNVIGRHVPKARRGERTRTVIIVAHTDSPKSAPQIAVRRFDLVANIRKVAMWLVPVLIIVQALPAARRFALLPWYLTLVPAVFLLLPLLVDLYDVLLAKATPGANDDATGLAALAGVMELLVPEPDAAVYETSSIPRVEVTRRTEEDAWAADVVPEDSLLNYAPAATPRRPFDDHDLDDLGWSDEAEPSKGQTSMPLENSDDVAWESFAKGSRAPGAGERTPSKPAEAGEKPRRTLLGGKQAEEENVRDWLGVDEGFDAKKEGRKIGSWDQFSDEDDDDLGWKGGSAGFDDGDVDAPDFAAEEAARIRRRVMSSPDRSLTEKEIWFVATGAASQGGAGMKAFLEEHAEDLRDALFVNIQAVGAGSVAWVTTEGVGKRLHADRRLTGTSRRVATENEMPIRSREYRGPVTDTTVALTRRMKAMSIMAFDINGRQPGVRTQADTVAAVSPDNIALTVDFVAKLISEL
jgi:hypothetical protein